MPTFAFRATFTEDRTGQRVTRTSTAKDAALRDGDLESAKSKAAQIMSYWRGITNPVVTDIHFYGDQWRAV